MNQVLPVMMLLSISIMPAFATQFDGKLMDSDTITIQFGDDAIDFRGNSHPVIESATLKANGSILQLPNPEIKLLGNSFVLKSINDDFASITYGINRGDSFQIKTLLFEGENLIKFQDTVTLQNKPSDVVGITSSNSTNIVSSTNNLHILTQAPSTVYNGADFLFDVKTYDKTKYSGNDFQNFYGKIDGINIVVVVKSPDGKVLDTQKGISKFGIYTGKVYVPENIWSAGWYSVEISADGDLGMDQKIINFYVLGTTANRGVACTQGKTLINGICQ